MEILRIEDAMRRHLALPGSISLTNEDGSEDSFLLSALPVEELPKLYKTTAILKGIEVDETDKKKLAEASLEILGRMSKEWLDLLADLGLKSLQPNYPDIPDSTLIELVKRNALAFADKIWDLNLRMGSKTAEKIEKIEAIRKRAHASGSGVPPTG